MIQENTFEYVYVDSSGYTAYELADDEKEWLMSEDRPEEFWKQRVPLMGKHGGYMRREFITEYMELLPPRSYHSDRSHPMPFV